MSMLYRPLVRRPASGGRPEPPAAPGGDRTAGSPVACTHEVDVRRSRAVQAALDGGAEGARYCRQRARGSSASCWAAGAWRWMETAPTRATEAARETLPASTGVVRRLDGHRRRRRRCSGRLCRSLRDLERLRRRLGLQGPSSRAASTVPIRGILRTTVGRRVAGETTAPWHNPAPCHGIPWAGIVPHGRRAPVSLAGVGCTETASQEVPVGSSHSRFSIVSKVAYPSRRRGG